MPTICSTLTPTPLQLAARRFDSASFEARTLYGLKAKAAALLKIKAHCNFIKQRISVLLEQGITSPAPDSLPSMDTVIWASRFVPEAECPELKLIRTQLVGRYGHVFKGDAPTPAPGHTVDPYVYSLLSQASSDPPSSVVVQEMVTLAAEAPLIMFNPDIDLRGVPGLISQQPGPEHPAQPPSAGQGGMAGGGGGAAPTPAEPSFKTVGGSGAMPPGPTPAPPYFQQQQQQQQPFPDQQQPQQPQPFPQTFQYNPAPAPQQGGYTTFQPQLQSNMGGGSGFAPPGSFAPPPPGQ
jgi:hypothetical protein